MLDLQCLARTAVLFSLAMEEQFLEKSVRMSLTEDNLSEQLNSLRSQVSPSSVMRMLEFPQ